MEQIKIESLSFSYPQSTKKSLDSISLEINQGSFIVLCGKSGCGKTTLLKNIKSVLAPVGEKQGRVLINGTSVEEMDLSTQTKSIGFVMQNPDTQIVCDKVWHELAFGLENLGLDTSQINQRVAEMSSYFGIGEWYTKNVNELSGGQKQMMNLASVMVMRPEILILDEPTAQLDPISSQKLLNAVDRINKELGVTVIISEHRLEDILTCTDRVIVMDDGRISADMTPDEIGTHINSLSDFIKDCVPTAMRLYSAGANSGRCPITVREGRRWLTQQNPNKFVSYSDKKFGEEKAVEIKDLYFRYTKKGADVLSNLSLTIPSNCIFAVVGGNGAGKTTLSKVIAGISKEYSGKIKVFGKQTRRIQDVTVLPQDVQALFTSNSVRQELEEMRADEQNTREIIELTGIGNILDSHPFDLSGGEQQRVALAKVLLTNAKLIVMDEPTKGMDCEFKRKFGRILKSLIEQGRTVIIISHDIEFCAKYTDMCTMLFDGNITQVSDTHTFFNNNQFYTTAAARISKGIIDGAVTDGEVISCLKEN